MNFSFVFLMIPRPPSSTRPYTLFPYTPLFRSLAGGGAAECLSALYADEDRRGALARVICQRIAAVTGRRARAGGRHRELVDCGARLSPPAYRSCGRTAVEDPAACDVGRACA